MNKIEFMRQLDILLMNLPIHEREEALQYYEDYFADAGEENEQAVIASLGSPAKVAENIKRDLSQSRGYVEYETQKVEPGNEVGEYRPVEEQNVPVSTPAVVEKKGGLSGGVLALIIVLCILASPILLIKQDNTNINLGTILYTLIFFTTISNLKYLFFGIPWYFTLMIPYSSSSLHATNC